MSFRPFLHLHTPKEALGCIARLGFCREAQAVALHESLGFVLAKDVFARRALPAFNAAAMDGYAFCASDVAEKFTIAATIYAGDMPPSRVFGQGECCKIMTGAPVPSGLDCVLPHEEVVLQGGLVCPQKPLKLGSHIRYEGEEIEIGMPLLKRGTRLCGGAVGLLAAQGIDFVQCYQPLSIAVCATGDELCNDFGNAEKYEVYNSNAPMIVGMLKQAGLNATDCGIIADEEQVFAENLTQLFQSHDCVITTGGASGGERDLVCATIESLGFSVVLHGVDIKPGKPVLVATKGRKVFLGLPGTPTGAFGALCVVGLPLLRYLLGRIDWLPTELEVPIAQSVQAKKGKHKIILGFFENGMFVPLPFALHSLFCAKAWILLPPECEQLQAHDRVRAYLI